MTRRHRLVLAGLFCLVALAGCFGPSEIPDDRLQENATYDWDTDVNASYTVEESSYQAVYAVANRSTISINTRDLLGVDEPVQISALQFRFPNGTDVNATHANLSATTTQSATEISLPASNGTVAYTAPRNGKRFSTPVAVPGSQSVTLPPNTRVGVPILSQVSPGNYSTDVADDRMTIRWPSVDDGTLVVRYYLQRDLLIFGSLLLIAIVVGGGGLVYYLRQIRQLESIRKEIGIDVDEDDDPRDRGPPPGMG